MTSILTEREEEIINKKIKSISLTQNESNILSKYIRPKLREMSIINSKELLKKLEYNQKARSIESRIKKLVLDNVSKVDSIIVCGSAVQSNYKEYNDIDVIILTKNSIKIQNKKEIIKKIEDYGKKENLFLDIQIYEKNSVLSQYSHNPSLIYQLKDSKVIYGKLNIPKRVSLHNLDLKMKLDWSEGLDIYSSPKEIYLALRNAMLVLLLINKKVDNMELKNTIYLNNPVKCCRCIEVDVWKQRAFTLSEIVFIISSFTSLKDNCFSGMILFSITK